MVKNLPTVQETSVRSLGGEDPLEKGMVTHSSILAWRIPWTEEAGRQQSLGSQRVGHYWVTNTRVFLGGTTLWVHRWKREMHQVTSLQVTETKNGQRVSLQGLVKNEASVSHGTWNLRRPSFSGAEPRGVTWECLLKFCALGVWVTLVLAKSLFLQS